MDQIQTPKGPIAHVSTLNRAPDASFSLVPYAIAVLVITIIGALTILVKFTSLASQEEQMAQALNEQKAKYDGMSEVAAKVENIVNLTDTLETAYAAQVPFGQVLDMLEQTSYTAATYDMVSIEKGGKVSLSGGVNRYSNFASLIKALKDTNEGDGITEDVRIDSVGQALSSETVGAETSTAIKTMFSITFDVKSDLFAKPSLFGGYTSVLTGVQPVNQEVPATQEAPVEEVPVQDDLTTIFNEAADGPPAETAL